MWLSLRGTTCGPEETLDGLELALDARIVLDLQDTLTSVDQKKGSSMAHSYEKLHDGDPARISLDPEHQATDFSRAKRAAAVSTMHSSKLLQVMPKSF